MCWSGLCPLAEENVEVDVVVVVPVDEEIGIFGDVVVVPVDELIAVQPEIRTRTTNIVNKKTFFTIYLTTTLQPTLFY